MGPLTLRTRYDVEGHIIRRDSEHEERGCDWQPGERLIGESVVTFGQHHQRRYSYSADGDLLHHRSLTDDYFSYDVAGNRVDRADQRVWRNLLTRLGQTRQRFDGFGRVCERRLASGVAQRLYYNSEQQLSRIEFSGDARFSHVEYGYDALGRRSRKVLYRHQPVGKAPIAPEVVTFLWQGMRLAEERSSRYPGQALKYLYHEGSHEPLARVLCDGSGSRIEWYHCALNGQPELLTDEQGKLIWRGIPLGWGNYGTQIGSYDRSDTLWSHQSLALQGQYVDQETGLHYNLHRYYCPLTARFTQPDPIGLAGGINPYQYAPNALSWIDPLGLKPCFSSSSSQEYAEGIITKYGGIRTAENRYRMPSRRAARSAASEISGDLGSGRIITRKPDFRGGPYTWKDSKGRIGVKRADGTAGWRDDVLGHPEIGAGSHVNAWNETKGIFSNLHLDY